MHLALVQTQVSHANIKGIDTSEAEKMPGVVKVVTHRDVKGKNRITGLITFPTNRGDGWDRPILCDQKVHQFGDAIAIACAETPAEAEAAAQKVKVVLEELPAYMSAPAAMAEDAMEIHPGTPNIYFEIPIVKGDAPCRSACNRREVGGAINIGALERACVASIQKPRRLMPLSAKTSHLAVLGSGLSSLTVAGYRIHNAYAHRMEVSGP